MRKPGSRRHVGTNCTAHKDAEREAAVVDKPVAKKRPFLNSLAPALLRPQENGGVNMTQPINQLQTTASESRKSDTILPTTFACTVSDLILFPTPFQTEMESQSRSQPLAEPKKRKLRLPTYSHWFQGLLPKVKNVNQDESYLRTNPDMGYEVAALGKQRGRTNGTLGNLHRLRMAGHDCLGCRGRCAGHPQRAATAAFGATQRD